MQFRLTYKGRLKGQKRDRDHIQELRDQFHKQLKTLWTQMPLSEHLKWLATSEGQKQYRVIENVSGFDFAPLVSSRVELICELGILLLRPALPGAIFKDGGDLDNRIKTLIDSLRVPKASELPPNWAPKEDQRPFYCLMQDDKLISAFSVTTDRLLQQTTMHEQDTEILIHVRINAVRLTMGNLSLVG